MLVDEVSASSKVSTDHCIPIALNVVRIQPRVSLSILYASIVGTSLHVAVLVRVYNHRMIV